MEAYWRGGARQRVGEGMLGGGEVGGWTGGERCIAQMIVRRTNSSARLTLKDKLLKHSTGILKVTTNHRMGILKVTTNHSWGELN